MISEQGDVVISEQGGMVISEQGGMVISEQGGMVISEQGETYHWFIAEVNSDISHELRVTDIQ